MTVAGPRRSRSKARDLDVALAETLPYILSLLGIAGADASLAMMDAGIRRRRTLEAVKRIIIRESLKQPLVVIFEDLHWIDAETQELLDLVVDSVASATRVLVFGSSLLESLNSPRQRFILQICSSGENQFLGS
jgi:predicted ATPase